RVPLLGLLKIIGGEQQFRFAGALDNRRAGSPGGWRVLVFDQERGEPQTVGQIPGPDSVSGQLPERFFRRAVSSCPQLQDAQMGERHPTPLRIFNTPSRSAA